MFFVLSPIQPKNPPQKWKSLPPPFLPHLPHHTLPLTLRRVSVHLRTLSTRTRCHFYILLPTLTLGDLPLALTSRSLHSRFTRQLPTTSTLMMAPERPGISAEV